jgi:hypothetical protein
MSDIDFDQLTADQLRQKAQEYRARDNKAAIDTPIFGLFTSETISPNFVLSPTLSRVKFRGVVVATEAEGTVYSFSHTYWPPIPYSIPPAYHTSQPAISYHAASASPRHSAARGRAVA